MANLLEQITRNGLIGFVDSPAAALSNEKIIAADKILEGVSRGDHNSIAQFRRSMGCQFGEAIHTTGDDFIFAFGQLTAAAVVNEWEAAVRTWEEAIEVKEVSSFNAPKYYSVNPVTDGFARPQSEPDKPAHIVPIVPEGSPYPHFKFSGEVAKSGALHKAGGRYDLTFEEIVNDAASIVPLIPELIAESLLEREEYDAWMGLITHMWVSANHLQGGETIDGRTVATDGALSREALIAAVEQAENREIIPGRKVNVNAWRLIVPRGAGIRANYFLNQISEGVTQKVDGLVIRSTTSAYNPIQKIAGYTETDYLTGSQWALIPDKGAIRGTRQFYKFGRLRGHVGPEVRVENATGQYLGGGMVAPFEGSFSTDSAAIRGRVIGGGLGWETAFAVVSDGDGVLNAKTNKA